MSHVRADVADPCEALAAPPMQCSSCRVPVLACCGRPLPRCCRSFVSKRWAGASEADSLCTWDAQHKVSTAKQADHA